MTTTTATHFTAWLVNDPSCLTGDTCDITVLRDEPVTYRTGSDGQETPVWGSTGDPLLHADTTVDARDGDIAEAQREAEELLAASGWRVAGGWEATDNAYIVTVEREDAGDDDEQDDGIRECLRSPQGAVDEIASDPAA
jgi:hypothetical protein